MDFPLNKIESPSPKDTLWKVWLKMAHWFWRRSLKCWQFAVSRQMLDKMWSEKFPLALSSGEQKPRIVWTTDFWVFLTDDLFHPRIKSCNHALHGTLGKKKKQTSVTFLLFTNNAFMDTFPVCQCLLYRIYILKFSTLHKNNVFQHFNIYI